MKQAAENQFLLLAHLLPGSKDNLKITESGETADVVIDTFTKQVWFANQLRESLARRISELEFAFPNDAAKLNEMVDTNIDFLTKFSLGGITRILNTLEPQQYAMEFSEYETPQGNFAQNTPINREEWTRSWLHQRADLVSDHDHACL